jgi:hypothetical protein
MIRGSASFRWQHRPLQAEHVALAGLRVDDPLLRAAILGDRIKL